MINPFRVKFLILRFRVQAVMKMKALLMMMLILQAAVKEGGGRDTRRITWERLALDIV